MTKTAPKRLAIIDGKSVFYRGYYAMPSLASADGTPTGGVYGFAAMSLELIKKLKPDYVCVAWDKPKTNIRRRKELYPEYKAGRKPAPPDFYAQIPILHELLEGFSWPLYEFDDYEADDIMGTLAIKAAKQGIETCLISSDLDMLQCVDELTHMYALKKGFSNIELFKPEYFEQKYGIRVDQFLDLKSLKGDSSDNIPGVPGIGDKGGTKLLQEYGTLDGVYEHIDEITGSTQKKLIAGKDSAYLSKEIARIWTDAPVELDLKAMDVNDLDTAEVLRLLKNLEFTSLIRNLPEHMKVVAEEMAEPELNVEPLKLVDFTETEQTKLTMSETVLTQLIDDALYVSADKETYCQLTPKQAVSLLPELTFVAHDGGHLYHYLLDNGAQKLPHLVHDTRQAAFLLNPLKKSRSLVELTGSESTEPSLLLASIWQVYDTQREALAKLPKLEKLAQKIDFPSIMLLAQMEHRGMYLDTEFLGKMSKELAEHIVTIQAEMYEMVGYEFNIGSPAQLAEVLFTKLQLPTIGIKKGKTAYSTGQKELDKLRGQHPIIELIEQFREYTKLQNTYVEALPKLVDEHSRLHTTFNQDVAATGRLSSTDPNLQNIPIRSEIGRKIRQAFVPAEGNVFVSADYSQFELRLAAVLSGDEKMINDFNAGTDIHAKTASDVYKIPLDDVTKDQRRDAKVINFGVLYGMSPHGLSAATGMSFSEAKKFIDEYFRLRAPIRSYIDKTLEDAKVNGYVETHFGRRRPTPDISSSNFIVREAAKRAAANMPIQGTEADLMKMAMLRVEEKLAYGASTEQSPEEERSAEKNSLPERETLSSSEDTPLRSSPFGVQVLQIHDSILIECSEQNADKVSKLLVETMENIYPDLGIKLQVDVSVGENWGEV